MTSLPLTRATSRPEALATTRSARWFYVGVAIAALVTVFVSFAPSFYLRPATKPALTLRVVAHGTLFSSWLVLFFVQTALAATGRIRYHRRLGLAAAGLAVIMVVTGPMIAVALARRGAPPGDPLAFMLIILVDLLFFGMFVGAAIYYRRQPEVHKRLMLLATISMLPPGLSRWPIAVRHPTVIPAVVVLFLGAALAFDFWTRRRIHPATLWGGLAFIVSMPVRFAIAPTAAWHQLASWLIR
jgi:uncharacterized membrane protein YozB (DUF420 family)